VYLDPPKERTGLRGWINRRTPYFWLYGLCGVVFGIFFIAGLPELMRPYDLNLHIRADPYVWSPQCPERQIESGDDIEFACAREEYRFTDQTKKLLTGRGGNTPYYRIGTNLIGLSCGYRNCTAQYIIKDAYYQK
jgi:hypothetical protein